MGVKYTGGPIVYQTSIPSSSSAALRSGLDAVIAPCAKAAATVTGGVKYTLQSPDGLQMKIWIQDLGDSDEFRSYVRVTPTSADEARAGQYTLLPFDGRTYEAWADQAGFFTAPIGDVTSPYNMAAAILALPSDSGPCNLGSSAPTVTELWCSSAGNSGIGQINWRNCIYASDNMALSYNGTLYTFSSGLGVLTMMPLCAPTNVNWQYGSPAAIQKYGSGVGLRIEPLVSLGQQIYGQIWDAHFYTLPVAVDTVVPLTDTDSLGNPVNSNWVAWNYTVPSSPTGGGGTVLGTLFLITGPPVSQSVGNRFY